MKKHNLTIEEVKSLSFNAFKAHYDATRQKGWKDAASHWAENDRARELWSVVIDSVLTAYETRHPRSAKETAKIAGLTQARLDAALAIQTPYNTPIKLRKWAEADEKLGRRVYYVHPLYWREVEPATKSLGPDIHSDDPDNTTIGELLDGTMFRVSPVVPTTGFYCVSFTDAGMIRWETFVPASFAVVEGLKGEPDGI